MKKLILLLLLLSGCGQGTTVVIPPEDTPHDPEIDRCISQCDIDANRHGFKYKKIVKCYRKCIKVEE